MDRVTENLGLARSVAHKYSKFDRGMYEDIFQEACLALVEADKTYDNSKSLFSTHATNQMRFKVLNYLKRNNTPGFTSRNAGILAEEIRKRGLSDKKAADVAAELKISYELAYSVLCIIHFTKSLEANLSDEENGSTLKDLIADENKSYYIHPNAYSELSELQKDVIDLVLAGYSMKEISEITNFKDSYLNRVIEEANSIIENWIEYI